MINSASHEGDMPHTCQIHEGVRSLQNVITPLNSYNGHDKRLRPANGRRVSMFCVTGKSMLKPRLSIIEELSTPNHAEVSVTQSKHTDNEYNQTLHRKRKNKINKKELQKQSEQLRLTMMMFWVTTAFILSWLPSWLYNFGLVNSLVRGAVFLNNIINPFVYFALNKEFSKAVKGFIPNLCFCNCKLKIHSQ